MEPSGRAPQRSFLAGAGIFFLAAGAYFALSLPFQDLYFPEGVVGLRLSGFVPMLFGLLFGPIGAAGCACGNVLLDAGGTMEWVDVFGTAGVFLMGWLPGRLWHTLFRGRKDGPVFFDQAASVLKYVLVAFISATCASAFPPAASALFGLVKYRDFFEEVMLQYYDESLFVGMLLFQLLTRYAGIHPYVPRSAYKSAYSALHRLPDYVCCVTACTAAWAMQTNGYFDHPVVCAVITACIIYTAVAPFGRGRDQAADLSENGEEGAHGLRGQFITGFLILFCGILAFYAGSTMHHMFEVQETGPGYWLTLLRNLAVASTAMVVVLYLLLLWIERRIVRPLEVVSTYANDFVVGKELNGRPLKLPSTGNEIDGLGKSIQHMTRELVRYMEILKHETAVRERAATELQMARRIQFSMLPPADARVPGFDVCAVIDPAREVGGDFYDLDALDEDRMFLCVADVSGKGVSAALFMMRAKTIIQSTDKEMALTQMMESLNDALAQQNDAMMFVTVFAAVLDRHQKTCTYVNAGHNPPVLVHGNRAEFLRSEPDLAAGPMEDLTYTEHTIALEDDFGLLLYTDGVTEAQNPQGAFYGEERLLDAVRGMCSEKLKAQQLVEGLRRDVREFADGAEQADDITILFASLE